MGFAAVPVFLPVGALLLEVSVVVVGDAVELLDGVVVVEVVVLRFLRAWYVVVVVEVVEVDVEVEVVGALLPAFVNFLVVFQAVGHGGLLVVRSVVVVEVDKVESEGMVVPPVVVEVVYTS